jgi:hypothetical protein
MALYIMRVASPVHQVNLKHAASDEESDDEATSSQSTEKKIDTAGKVQEAVDSLKSKHGTKYTVFQIWAELVSVASTPPLKNRHVITQCSEELGVVPVVRKSKTKTKSMLFKP